MTTHLTDEQMRNYLVRRISTNELGKMSEHLHGCRTCYEAYLSVLQTRFPIEIDFDELAGLKGWHLEGEELVSYLGGRMNKVDLDYARLHLQECSACEQKVYDATRNGNPYVSSMENTSRKDGVFWHDYLPKAYSILSVRWNLAGAAALVVVLALIMWAVLQPKSDGSQFAGVPPPETISPDPSSPQPAASVQSGLGASDEIGKNVDDPTPDQLSVDVHSETRQVTRQEGEIERALIAKNLTMPPAIEMLDKTPSIAVRGNAHSDQAFKVILPSATVINNDRPTFFWTALSGATSYTVSVYDADLHLVRRSEALTDTQWSVTERLEAGIIYTWSVTAQKDGREIVAPASPARAEFQIFPKTDLIKLNRRIGRTVSHSVRGVLYAEAGLLDEAEREFQAHLTDYPADKRAKKLLQTVKSWRDPEGNNER